MTPPRSNATTPTTTAVRRASFTSAMHARNVDCCSSVGSWPTGAFIPSRHWYRPCASALRSANCEYSQSKASRLTPMMAAMNSRNLKVVSDGKANGLSRTRPCLESRLAAGSAREPSPPRSRPPAPTPWALAGPFARPSTEPPSEARRAAPASVAVALRALPRALAAALSPSGFGPRRSSRLTSAWIIGLASSLNAVCNSPTRYPRTFFATSSATGVTSTTAAAASTPNPSISSDFDPLGVPLRGS